MAKYEWYDANVVDIQNETATIKKFYLEFPTMTNFDFTAGQFVMLDLPIDRKKKTREYSIASCPGTGNVIELIIVLNEEGSGTPYLFDKIEVGSIIKTSSALGKFVLPAEIDKDVYFISTGVGIAPLRSMWLDMVNNDRPHKDVYMIFGTRHITDMCYPDEMNEFDQRDDFNFLPTLSREESPEWTGRKGYVHAVYEELIGDGKDAYFYICGWRNMILQARDRLLEIGYDRKQVKYELYD
ncbi:MAG: oxidoreductase [Bacteroidetes bacterium]|nr:oxidoreductase [Bacteroidia bacterium]PCH67489.1 MAG: oxidoreductase [Bacteroidota bacterium]